MNYPYAIGIIKSIEDRILDKSKLSKLFKLNRNDIIKNLKDMGYGTEEAKDSDLEHLIKSEIIKTRIILETISPEPKYIDLFYLSFDALNIKVLWKMKIFNSNHKYLLVNSGSIDIDILYDAIMNDNYESLDKRMAKLLKDIEDEVKDLSDPRTISTAIDKIVYDYVFKILGKIPNAALYTYFQTIVDIANITMLIRSLKLDWQIERLEEMLISHGKIKKEVYLSAYSLGKDKIATIFRDYYNELLSKILDEYFRTNNLTIFEQRLSAFLIAQMREFQYDSLSIGPLVYYYLIKEAEAKNIRMIYANSHADMNDLLDY